MFVSLSEVDRVGLLHDLQCAETRSAEKDAQIAAQEAEIATLKLGAAE